MSQQLWMTTPEAARLLGITHSAIWSRIHRGLLPAKVNKAGNYVVLRRDVLIAAARKSLGKYGEKQP